MKTIDYKNIFRATTIALTLFVSVFVASGVNAQSVNVPETDGDPDIVITARVLGCGDNIAQTGLGEQCDGPDLNSQTCSSIGFGSGTLGCRPSCIFETLLCTNPPGGNGDAGSGGGVRDVSDIFNNNVPDTNVVFTGQGEPGSTFFVIGNGGYITSVTVNDNGNFSITVSEPTPGEYDFKFYTISSRGLFGPKFFTTDIMVNATTYINNIFIPYDVLEIIDTEEVPGIVDQIPEINSIQNNNPEEIVGNTNQFPADELGGIDIGSGIDGDVFADFLNVLAQNENLDPDELRALIEVFADRNGYEAKVPGYTNSSWRTTQRWLSEKTNGLSEWYPNVYVSFMVPYWNVIYDLTDWFNEYKAPFEIYKFFL